MSLSLSIVLPVYNRVPLLAHPLASLRAAAAAAPGLEWEVIVVDDGSTEDVSAVTAAFADLPIRLHRQENRGLLGARLAGLALARHEAVLFLDADDLVAPGKFARQLPALRNADVTYGDVGRMELPPPGQPPRAIRADAPLASCPDPAEFYLGLQPAPHNPIFRRGYLNAAVAGAFFPAARTYDSIAETWFYYQLAVHPARILHVPGIWTIVGDHPGERVSRAWERQAWAALALMRMFMRHCPVAPETEAARRRVGLCAFGSWRALPHGFHGFPVDDFLAVWRAAPRTPLAALGGRGYRRLATVTGPVLAGRILRRWQRPAYSRIRTLDATQLAALVHG